jgi:CxxC motif-containing protein (DUF1111 family)
MRLPPYGDCTPSQPECRHQAGEDAGDGVDVDDEDISRLATFVLSLAPATRAAELPVAKVFVDAGCAACHVPALPEADADGVAIYSDLLLHDMGEGLSSGAPEGSATAQEWRTTPLVGWRGRVAGHRYLHDGRAATLDEAIRWHGGEAAASRDAYLALNSVEKLKLATFVQSLLTALSDPLGETRR